MEEGPSVLEGAVGSVNNILRMLFRVLIINEFFQKVTVLALVMFLNATGEYECGVLTLALGVVVSFQVLIYFGKNGNLRPTVPIAI